MPIELKIPELGESITEVQIGEWLKAEGDSVAQDEKVVTIESEKATVELPAPVAGTLVKILKQNGQNVIVGEVIAFFEKVVKASVAKAKGPAPEKPSTRPPAGSRQAASEEMPKEPKGVTSAEAGRSEKPGPKPPASSREGDGEAAERAAGKIAGQSRVMPAAQRLMMEHGLRADEVEATGPGGRLLKEDVLRHLAAGQASGQAGGQAAGAASTPAEPAAPAAPLQPLPAGSRAEEIVPMSPLRRTVARRLVEAQNQAALLTTINEIDMSSVLALRKEFQEAFRQKYQVKLGLMSFFVKATIEALKQIPQLNAEVRGTDMVFRNYYDIGIAIGSGKGLVVPVVRNAERLSFAQIEKAIDDFARRAKENKLSLEELQGGTFTISNGDVYGSLLSTPIVNPPQSGVLGLHAIQDRPVALEGTVAIRPMMYVALTYDHRIVDGREAVTFLRRIKEVLERPARLLIEV